MVDNWLREVPGNYGVVYQDFATDACTALMEVRDEIAAGGRLKVMVMPQSLYGSVIVKSLKAFAEHAGVDIAEYRSVPPVLERGDVVLLLNSQLVLGGLTVLSTDFPAMGRSAAQMILEGCLSKIHNPFRLVRRKTF